MPLVLAVLLVVASWLSGARAQVSDPPRGDVRLVVLGDFNGPYGALEYPPGLARALLAAIDVWRPDLLLSPGDVIAGQSRDLPDDRFAAMWEAFDAAVAGPLRSAGIAYVVAMGNHDASSLKGSDGGYLFERERRAAQRYWTAHGPDLGFHDRDGYPFDYSFASHGLFVVVLDASSATVSAEQRSWLTAQLASDAAVQAAGRIVVGHLPLAPVALGRDRQGEYLADGVGLAAAMLEGAVDLYVSGHQAAFYAGRLGELELLFAGGVGGRRLLGSEAAPRSTVTVVDVWLARDASRDAPTAPPAVQRRPTLVYTTFDLSTMTVVGPSELPAAIGDVVLSGRMAGTVVAQGDE